MTVSDQPLPPEGAQGPDNPHGGLNVVDFPKPGLIPSIRKAVHLLPPSKRRLLYVAAGFQVSLGILDLLGIALIGLVASVAVSGIGVTGIPDWAQNILQVLGLDRFTVSQQSVIIALFAVAILVLKTGLAAFMTRRITRFLAHRQADVSTRLAKGFLSRPLTDVQRWTTSEAIYALGPGAGAATVSLLGAAIIIASEVFLFVILGVALFVYDPLLTISALVFFGIIVAILHRGLGSRTARNADVIKDASIDTLTAVSEALATYRETTVLNRRDLYITRYERLVGKYAVSSASNAFIMEIPKYVLEVALYVGVLVLGVVQFLTKDWGAAAATIAFFLAAGSRVIPALLRLQGAGITIRNASVAAQPTFFMADFIQDTMPATLEPSDRDRMTAQRIHQHIVAGYPDFEATIRITDVTFTYTDANAPALLGADAVIPAGSSVALVGPTGAGKSTLADIILGVLEPQTGSVDLGGLSPKDAINQWPGAIAYVPQVVALVEGTVRDNVALGLPANVVSDDLVWEALHRAHLADFLIEHREGLDTAIGERGFRLSGGQRQRLGIARALYTRPKLLVLDEATSSLDAETELAIIQTLEELEGSVTTVTIAHRLATVRGADQVLYLEDGRIVARGAFEVVRSRVPDFDRQASLLGL